MTLCIMVCLWL